MRSLKNILLKNITKANKLNRVYPNLIGYTLYFLFGLALRSESGIARSNLLLSDVRVEVQIAPLQSIDRQIVGGDIIDVAGLILGAMQHTSISVASWLFVS